MENIKKNRLLELISKKDEVLNTSNWDRDSIYAWLEEIDYLLNSLKALEPMAKKVRETIKSLKGREFQYTTNFSRLKAELEVFKRYEFDSIEFE